MEPELIKQEIKSLLDKMTFGEDVDEIEDHQGATSRFNVRLRGGWASEENEDSYGERVSASQILIGERGVNLSALEYILKRLLHKKYGEITKFTLDINDYRIRRLEDLKQDVKAAAREVRTYKREVPLRPMSSFERRIVHLLLAEYPDIATESVGQEPERKVIIKPYP